MKHAFLIIAHTNWWQLKQLIGVLDDYENDIFVHIDKKSTSFRYADFKHITKYSELRIYSEYDVYWGDYSQVAVELFLGEKAFEIGYDYYHYLSGFDLPIEDMKYIHGFFEKNQGFEFIDYDEEKLLNDPEISRRTKLYHFLQSYRRRYEKFYKNCFFTFIERCLLFLQIIMGVNRTRDNSSEIKYGSQWVGITNSLMKTVLEQKSKIHSTFIYTNCADELFIQTIAYNYGFKDKLFSHENKTDNLRFIDWARGSNVKSIHFPNE